VIVPVVVNPSCAKRMAVESPIPDDVPVISAIFDISAFSLWRPDAALRSRPPIQWGLWKVVSQSRGAPYRCLSGRAYAGAVQARRVRACRDSVSVITAPFDPQRHDRLTTRSVKQESKRQLARPLSAHRLVHRQPLRRIRSEARRTATGAGPKQQLKNPNDHTLGGRRASLSTLIDRLRP
jgi:hypothetical protein